MNTKQLLFLLIRACFDGARALNNLEPDVKELYELSSKHDLAHMVSYGAIKHGLISNNSEFYDYSNKQVIIAIARYKQQDYELERIRKAFNCNCVQFIPLKGSILREYYPEPWMRTSCDIDILIHEDDLNKASKLLLSLGYTTNGIKKYHDISFHLNNIHVELHFNICENKKQLDVVLKDAWNYVERVKEYEYREKGSFFVFHHIAHMAYHFLSGGCGVRSVLDLWVLRRKFVLDKEELLTLLEKSQLSTFYKHVCLLSEIWFGDAQHDNTTLAMERFILKGGAYGSIDSGAISGAAAHEGNKLEYTLSVTFPPFSSMCCLYPSLKKRKALLPFYYLHRLFSKVFGKESKQTRKHLRAIHRTSQKEINEFSYLTKKLELNG